MPSIKSILLAHKVDINSTMASCLQKLQMVTLQPVVWARSICYKLRKIIHKTESSWDKGHNNKEGPRGTFSQHSPTWHSGQCHDFPVPSGLIHAWPWQSAICSGYHLSACLVTWELRRYHVL